MVAATTKLKGIGSLNPLYVVIFSILFLSTSALLFSSTIFYQPALAIKNTATSNNTSLDHKPIAQSMILTTIENEPVEFKLNATDEDQGDTLNFTIVSNPRFGNITFFDPQTGEGLFRPLLQQEVGLGGTTLYFAGSDAFVFKVTDSKGNVSNSATVTIRSE